MRRLGLPIATSLAALALVTLASPAVAAPADTVDDGAPGLLTIEANPLSIDLELDPGEHGEWLLAPHLEAETVGALTLTLQGTGGLVADAAGLRIQIAECSVAWTPVPGGDAVCAGAESVVLAETPYATATAPLVLGALPVGGDRFFRMRFSLPASVPAAMQGASADLRIGFSASGYSATVDTDPDPDPPTTPSGGLPPTGAMIGIPLGLAAALAALGAGLRASERRRTR